MSPSEKRTASGLLGCGGVLLLILAANSLYLGFLSPMNRGRNLGGGAAFLALLFGVPGAYMLYRANSGPKRGPTDSGGGTMP